MVSRLCIKCNFCKTKILLRFQMGEFDIPFSFSCPMCNVNISGLRKISNNSIELNNATIIGEEEPNYFADLSVELPHRKIQKYISFESMYSNGVSPFIDTMILFQNSQDYMRIMESIRDFISFKDNNWNFLRSMYDLYMGNKIEQLFC